MIHHVDIKRRKAWDISGLLGLVVFGFSFLLAFVLVASPVLAQSNRDLSVRLQRAEKEIETLSRALFRGENPPPGAFSGSDSAATADLEVRLQQMEQELRNVRGQLEEREFDIRELKAELARLTSDLELRVSDLEKSGGGSGSAARNITARPSPQSPRLTPPQPTSQPTSSSTSPPQPSSNITGSAGEYRWDSNKGQQLGSYTQSGATGAVSGGGDLAVATYDNAFALIKQNQYDAAEREFQAFLDAYPEHSLAGNAKYWLGETFYVRGKYDRAARFFAEGYQKFPNGAKAPDNLLKLALSLSALGKKGDACVALGQIEKEGFKGAGPVLRRAEQESSRLGC